MTIVLCNVIFLLHDVRHARVMLQERFAREMQEKQNALLQEQERMKAEKEELRKKQQRLFQLASSFSTS